MAFKSLTDNDTSLLEVADYLHLIIIEVLLRRYSGSYEIVSWFKMFRFLSDCTQTQYRCLS